MPTQNYNLPTISLTDTGDIPRDYNALATAVDGALTSVQQHADTSVSNHTNNITAHVLYAAATGGVNTYAVTLAPTISTYVEGMAAAVKINVQNTAASTLNVNGLGAKAIKRSNGSDVIPGMLKAGSVHTMRYNGVNFILQGEGGEYGTAVAGDVLAPKTIGTENGLVTGTIQRMTPYTDALSVAQSGGTTYVRVPNGAYLENTSVGHPEIQFNNPDCHPDSIINGKVINGVVGNAIRAEGNAYPSAVLEGLTYTSNHSGAVQTGTMPNYTNGGHIPALQSTVWQGQRVFLMPPYGAFNNGTWIYVDEPNLKSEHIRSGVEILGVTGTLREGYGYSRGTYNLSNRSIASASYANFWYDPNHLGFVPGTIFIRIFGFFGNSTSDSFRFTVATDEDRVLIRTNGYGTVEFFARQYKNENRVEIGMIGSGEFKIFNSFGGTTDPAAVNVAFIS